MSLIWVNIFDQLKNKFWRNAERTVCLQSRQSQRKSAAIEFCSAVTVWRNIYFVSNSVIIGTFSLFQKVLKRRNEIFHLSNSAEDKKNLLVFHFRMKNIFNSTTIGFPAYYVTCTCLASTRKLFIYSFNM